MRYNNNNNKWELDCLTCFNNGKICPCQIYSGNVNFPNLYNQPFPVENKKKAKQIIKKDLYTFTWT